MHGMATSSGKASYLLSHHHPPPPEQTINNNTSYFYSNYHHFHDHNPFPPGTAEHEMMMMRYQMEFERTPMVEEGVSNSNNNSSNQMMMMMERKRRLRRDQIDWLERSFQEDVKLEPERKMKLSQELGLHPRQVAIWFQNRRARWKTKQLERLYDSLKQEFDVVSREKQNLQEEVIKLRAKLENLERMRQVSTRFLDASTTDEAVKSTFPDDQISSRIQGATNYHQMIAGCSSYISSIHGHNSASPTCWGVFPPGYPKTSR